MDRQLGLPAGLHTTDANALVHILAAQDAGAPLTRTQLSHRVGLTGRHPHCSTGSKKRTHPSCARQCRPPHRHTALDQGCRGADRWILQALAERLGSVMDHHSPEVLAEFERFLSDVADTMGDYLAEKAAASN
ncbi:hypothetical protein [Subtercola boreus]|uniref:hypothetical protein n=1 Tax=Subtercola boreus TaxID=120213 RepID=UPI0011C0264E|nr:hypothetical protein [Subtercola boreus]